MSEAKHTPGPWIPSGLDYIGINGEKVVVSDGPAFGSAAIWPDAAANARLILAAPDLLEALETIIQWNRDHAEAQYGDPNKCETWACVVKARSAIAKATGATT